MDDQSKMQPPPYMLPTAPEPGFVGQPPPPGYSQPYPQVQAYPQPYPQSYPMASQPMTMQPAPSVQPTTTNIVINTPQIGGGTCTACRVGFLKDSYTCCGICCAIFFFPIGLICCCCWKKRVCDNCGANFS